MPTKAKPSDTRDLLILGGGLVGMTLALAAAKKGISSHVVLRLRCCYLWCCSLMRTKTHGSNKGA